MTKLYNILECITDLIGLCIMLCILFPLGLIQMIDEELMRRRIKNENIRN